MRFGWDGWQRRSWSGSTSDKQDLNHKLDVPNTSLLHLCVLPLQPLDTMAGTRLPVRAMPATFQGLITFLTFSTAVHDPRSSSRLVLFNLQTTTDLFDLVTVNPSI